MRKISAITSYVDENNEFTDGDIPGGKPPTPLLALWFNVIQREIVNCVEGAGLELDADDDAQLWKALSGMLDKSATEMAKALDEMKKDLDTTKSTVISSCVSAVRLGAVSSYTPLGNEISWSQDLTGGRVLTGITIQDTGDNSADNIGGINHRPVQYCVNGNWISAVSI
ncbi:hypothetical protein [Escherichia coli]|uniref:hypothetical protein n=1 Tax=Escherichia coli TaxID=562 RepID=UPI001F0D50B8|nr:hypothetical protein [Escherichia coli]UMR99556.1 hypothetical protein AOY87_15715 [Escherichia coli]